MVAANKSRPSLKHVGRQVRADFPRREGVNWLHLGRETAAVLAEAIIYTRLHIFFCLGSRVIAYIVIATIGYMRNDQQSFTLFAVKHFYFQKNKEM